MINAKQVIRRFEAQGVRMIPNGDKLKLRGNIDSLSPEQMAWLKEHKAELLAALRVERLAQELGTDAGELLEWFADDLEHLARMR